MKIVYFYPENPLHLVQGNNARALALLKYFKIRNIEVDFIGEGTEIFTEKEIQQLKNQKLINKGYLIKRFKKSKNQLSYFFNYSLRNIITGKLKRFNNVKPKQQASFDAILKNNSYDFIIISYACWAEFIRNNSYIKNAKLIIDTHDFLTAQFQGTKNFKLGKCFETEMSLLNLFDTIMAISIEEQYLYSQFTDKNVVLVTHSLNQNYNSENNSKKYDIIYVASDNPHNKKAAKWFFEKVYPLLQDSLKILVIGKIGNTISNFKNVQKITSATDLNPYYCESKIAICPMFSGTGLKIKVVEALSFGLPVVTNYRGIDGLINKTQNGCLVTENHEEFANYCQKLLTDEMFHNNISLDAKKYFAQNNTIEITNKELDKIFCNNKK